jgi:hypothetical protein
VLSGDTGQHSSVTRGDALRILEQYSGYRFSELTTIRRQKPAAFRQVVELAAAKQTDKAFAKLLELGAVTEALTDDGQLYQRAADAYLSATKQGRSALLVSPTWAEIEAVTDKVRDTLKARASSAKMRSRHRFDSLSWTEAQKKNASQFEPGQRLRFVRKTKHFDRGETVEVVATVEERFARPPSRWRGSGFHPGQFRRLLRRGRGPRVESVAAGDWLLLQANHGKEFINGERVQVREIQNGRIALADGRSLPAGFNTFTHGYAVTSHSSQSKTVDDVLLVASSRSFAAVNREQFYVSFPVAASASTSSPMTPIARPPRHRFARTQGRRRVAGPARWPGQTRFRCILNQRGKNVICVYCAIGQRASAVAKVIANLREKGAMDYTVVVVAEGNDAPGLTYVTPYAATSIAEYFMEKGRDVLIVYDNLTQHAEAYRELSLLLRRPPGREAFPGDIFYIHSRMLERATHLSKERGGGSLTALPIIETEAQDISAYIPTNLISITDGQIYLSPSLFELGVLPAVDVGKSVSRVGGEAQWAAYRAVAGDLKLAYAQFEELETFARFGARLDDDTRKIIEHGRRIRACLKQPESAPLAVPAQITVLLALTANLFDPVPLDQMTEPPARRARGCGQHSGGGERAI